MQQALLMRAPLHNEESSHADAIAGLVSKVKRPASEVRQTCEAVYLELNSDAHVRTYLPLLVTRRTHDLLKRGSGAA